jgi:hypothetical protein
MTISIILGRKHGSNAVEMVNQPSDPTAQNAIFNQMSQGTGNGYAEIYLHELRLSAGRKQKIFKPSVGAAAPAEPSPKRARKKSS